MFEWLEDEVVRFVAGVILLVVLVGGATAGALAGGTALWRSHNTDPRIGTVWTGGTFSSAREKCYGINLIVTDDNGLAAINNAPQCTGGK